MTATTTTLAPQRPRLVSRPLALVFAASFGVLTSFFLLLSVVPVYATSIGAGGVGAGLVTGALLGATVLAELGTPRLLHRFGARLALGTGLILVGAPALALPMTHTMTGIVVVCVLRGAGFAICVVVTGSLVAGLVPAERRGEALGLHGVVVCVPGIIGLPSGVWLAMHAGYPVVFVAAAVASLLGVAVLPGLPKRRRGTEPPVRVLAGLRNPALNVPAAVFGVTAAAAGIIIAFLPLATTGTARGVVEVALLVQTVMATAGRWLAGLIGDRIGAARLLAPGVLVCGIGMFATIANGSAAAVLIGMAVAGIGFGVAQNSSFVLMLDRAGPSGHDAVSAVWNMAYDAGMGAGAAGFGLLTAHTGYPVGFAVIATLVLVAAVPALRRSTMQR